MKKLIYSSIIIALFGIIILSCKKDKIQATENQNSTSTFVKNNNIDSKSNDYSEYGDAHNYVIDKFYSENNEIGLLSFEEKITLIDLYLSEINSNISEGSFILFLDENPSIKQNLQLLCVSGKNLSDVLLIHDDLNANAQITDQVYYYANKIVSAYATDNSNINNVENILNGIRTDVSSDLSLSQEEKEYLLKTISVSKGSVNYWEDHILPAGNWVGMDAAGGTTAITSGMAGWACSFGPWGGFIAIVGCAAAASIFS